MLKKTVLLTSLSIYVFAQNPFFKPLPFKEAIVEYHISGNKKGFETLYIKDFGKSRVYYQNIKGSFISKKRKQEHYIIETKKWIYHLHGDRTATKVPNLKYLLYIRYKELSDKEKKEVEKNLSLLNYLPIESQKFKIAKDFTKVDGKSCDLLLQKSKSECYGYSGALLLKSKIKFLGYNSTKLLYNIYETKVDPKLFDTTDLNITTDKIKSVKLYELSKKIIDKLKRKLNPKAIFINIKEKDKDVQQIISEGIKSLNDI